MNPDIPADCNNLEDQEWEKVSEDSEDIGDEISDPEQAWMNIKSGLESGNLHESDLNVFNSFSEVEFDAPSNPSTDGRSSALRLKSLILFQKYEDESDPKFLSEAISSLEEALPSKSHSRYSRILQVLAKMMGERYSIGWNPDDFERGVLLGQEALKSSVSEEARAHCLHTLSKLYQFYFATTSALNDLEVAIETGRQAMDIVPHDDSCRSIFPENLAQLYTERFHILSCPADLDTAIKLGSQALEWCGDDENRPVYYMRLSNSFGLRFEAKEDSGDLSEAIRLAEVAIHLTDQRDHSLAERLCNLSTLLQDRFDRHQSKSDLKEAIRLAERAIDIDEQLGDESQLVTYLSNYASLLDGMYCAEGDFNYLVQAVEITEKVLCRINEGTEDRVLYLSHAADIFARRFGCLEHIEDLKKAINIKEEALATFSTNAVSMRRTDIQMDLGGYLHNMYVKTGSSDCLKRAVELTAPIIEQGFTEGRVKPSRMAALAQRAQDRYRITGSLDDLLASISIAEKSVELIPRDHPFYPNCVLELSHSLEESFDANGSLADLDRSISISMDGLNTLPEMDWKREEFLYALSHLFLKRYNTIGLSTDLEESIRSLEECKNTTSDDGPMKLACLHELSKRYSVLHDRSRNIQQLKQAIRYAEKANDLCPNHPMTKANILNGLGFHHLSSFAITDEESDLQQAIFYHRAALQTIPEDYPERNFFLSCLGSALTKLFHCSDDLLHLSEAYQLCTQALNETRKGHALRAELLNDKGEIIEFFHQRNMGSEIISNAGGTPLSLFTEALNQQNAPILDRIKSGQKAFDCYIARSEWTKAARVAEETMRLFRILVPRWLSRDDQQHLLKNIARFASRAASALIQSGGSADNTLQLLERGRGFIIDLSVDLKTDISKLHNSHSALHAEYIQLRRQVLFHFASPVAPLNLDIQRGDRPFPKLLNTGSDRGRNLQKLEALEAKIRSVDGFEQFLCPLSPCESMELAGADAIVAFNVTELRSDAILINKDQIQTIHLDGLDFHTMKRNVSMLVGPERLSAGKPSTRARRNRDLSRILSWLWEVAVKPVIENLGLDRKQRLPGPLGRVCWITNGEMGLLPLHAAGNDTQNTLDYVVSSYTTTLQVLKFSKERHESMPVHNKLKMLIVPAPKKAGSKNLETAKEIGSIEQALLNNISPSILEEPILERVLEELPKHDIIHFSCHGDFDLVDPSSNALRLSSRDDLNGASFLTVRDLAALDLENSQVVYLSACSTAKSSVPELIDEMIHIASAFQITGFPHVIGTFWEVSDNAACQISPEFYKILSQQSTRQNSRRDVAYALHVALKDYRGRNPQDALSWSAFIHMGA